MEQSILRLTAGGGGEGFHDADYGLVLGIFAGLQVTQSGQHGLGGGSVPAQRRQPPPLNSHVILVAQSPGARRLGQLSVGGVPVAQQQQRLDQVHGRNRQMVADSRSAQMLGSGAGGFRGSRRVGDRQYV